MAVPTLDATVEALVDDVRNAAAQVREAKERAERLKEAFGEINEEDEWERYKAEKCLAQQAEQLELEAQEAYQRIVDQRPALMKMNAGQLGPLGPIAKRAVGSAYSQANEDINCLRGLVDDVKGNYIRSLDTS